MSCWMHNPNPQTSRQSHRCLPHGRRAFEPLVEEGFVDIVYGGGKEGAFLCNHPLVRTTTLHPVSLKYDSHIYFSRRQGRDLFCATTPWLHEGVSMCCHVKHMLVRGKVQVQSQPGHVCTQTLPQAVQYRDRPAALCAGGQHPPDRLCANVRRHRVGLRQNKGALVSLLAEEHLLTAIQFSRLSSSSPLAAQMFFKLQDDC